MPVRHTRIAVASGYQHHFEVYLTLVSTLERVFGKLGARGAGASVSVYSPPYGYRFQEVADEIGLHHGAHYPIERLVPDLSDVTGDGAIDMVVFGTCELDINWFSEALLAAWDARDEAHKFQLVCFAHSVRDDTQWQGHITEWARRGAFRVLTLGDQVTEGYRRLFAGLADDPDPRIYTAGYEYVAVDTHVPVLDLPHLPPPPPPPPPANRTLARAVIQGTFEAYRRDYDTIFRELIADLTVDPGVWGYLPLDGRAAFAPDPHAPRARFELLLVGSGEIEVPGELAGVVSVHRDLDYPEFYALIAGADVLLPAFSQFGYYDNQASFTTSTAVQLNIPMLVTNRTRRAYGYLDDPRAVITRPAAMHDVAALRALRTGDAAPFDDDGGPARVRAAVREMLAAGWVRPRAGFEAYKREVWRRNERVSERLVRDL
ncbi:hypothetical protein BKA93DRAFT_739936 [Sparassis latifolia]